MFALMSTLTVVAVVMAESLIELLTHTQESVREHAHTRDTLLTLNGLEIHKGKV